MKSYEKRRNKILSTFNGSMSYDAFVRSLCAAGRKSRFRLVRPRFSGLLDAPQTFEFRMAVGSDCRMGIGSASCLASLLRSLDPMGLLALKEEPQTFAFVNIDSDRTWTCCDI